MSKSRYNLRSRKQRNDSKTAGKRAQLSDVDSEDEWLPKPPPKKRLNTGKTKESNSNSSSNSTSSASPKPTPSVSAKSTPKAKTTPKTNSKTKSKSKSNSKSKKSTKLTKTQRRMKADIGNADISQLTFEARLDALRLTPTQVVNKYFLNNCQLSTANVNTNVNTNGNNNDVAVRNGDSDNTMQTQNENTNNDKEKEKAKEKENVESGGADEKNDPNKDGSKWTASRCVVLGYLLDRIAQNGHVQGMPLQGGGFTPSQWEGLRDEFAICSGWENVKKSDIQSKIYQNTTTRAKGGKWFLLWGPSWEDIKKTSAAATVASS